MCSVTDSYPPLQLRPDTDPLLWQEEACRAWVEGAPAAGRRPGTGIIEAVTGTGKSLAAMMCRVEASKRWGSDLQFAVVVPGRQHARQWKNDRIHSAAASPTSPLGM